MLEPTVAIAVKAEEWRVTRPDAMWIGTEYSTVGELIVLLFANLKTLKAR
jgi:hypothetical protein